MFDHYLDKFVNLYLLTEKQIGLIKDLNEVVFDDDNRNKIIQVVRDNKLKLSERSWPINIKTPTFLMADQNDINGFESTNLIEAMKSLFIGPGKLRALFIDNLEKIYYNNNYSDQKEMLKIPEDFFAIGFAPTNSINDVNWEFILGAYTDGNLETVKLYHAGRGDNKGPISMARDPLKNNRPVVFTFDTLTNYINHYLLGSESRDIIWKEI